MDGPWGSHFRQVLEEQAGKGLARVLVGVNSSRGPEITLNGRPVLLFCSNDYLGYRQHPALKEAAVSALAEWGTGAGASRLISGNLALYEDLEKEAAAFKQAEAALVFATGYMANIGMITGLTGPEDLILSDSLNHASLVDGCRLSKAQLRIIPHASVEAYAAALEQAQGRRVLMVTDGVFSMDGDVAPVSELAVLARKHQALLAVDDAHGTGVLGTRGRGILEYAGVDPRGIIQVGTFSKALGSLGGFVAGPELVVEVLKNRARPFFYSTALPPATLAVNRRALALIDQEPWLRERLRQNVAILRQGLAAAGLELIPGPSAIVPVLVGPAGLALAMSRRLLDQGLFCPAIRPPTVPEGRSRLRLSVMAVHTREQVERAVDLIEGAARKEGLI